MALLVCMTSGCDSWSSNIEIADTDGSTDGMTEGGTDSGDSTTGSSASASASNSGSASASASDSDSDSTSTTTSTTGDDSTSTSTSTTGDDASTGDDGGTPSAPNCAVERVTQGALTDPMERGGAGMLHPDVAQALENVCGCHTLENNAQNIEFGEFQSAPGGTLFLTFGDLSGNLGTQVEQQINQLAMPPGNCSYPSADRDVLEAWIMQGRPDGANYTPL